MASDTSSSHAAASPGTRSGPWNIAGKMLDRIVPTPAEGRLRLMLPGGDVVDKPGRRPGPEAEMSVHRWRGIWRFLIDGEAGFTDGYLDGDWSTADLPGLLDFFTANEETFVGRARNSRLTDARRRLLHRRRENTKRGSRRNIAAHYDLGNAFYAKWLDDGMNYSSALYAGGETLKAAQDAKLDRVVSLLELTGGESILEIGCGWGALAERLVRRERCAVTGVTLSSEQLRYATRRIAAIDGPGRADLRLQDYRDVEGQYDRIASIEMIEAVGERYWPAYFDKLRASLSPGGTAVIQSITIDERRFPAYRACPDFIQRYIFPGGMLPTVSRIEEEAARANLTLVSRQAFGESYAQTVADWRCRFTRSWPSIQRLGFDDRFRRMWEYYLAYCEVGFRRGAVDVNLFKLRG